MLRVCIIKPVLPALLSPLQWSTDPAKLLRADSELKFNVSMQQDSCMLTLDRTKCRQKAVDSAMSCTIALPYKECGVYVYGKVHDINTTEEEELN